MDKIKIVQGTPPVSFLFINLCKVHLSDIALISFIRFELKLLFKQYPDTKNEGEPNQSKII